ncbi:MAG: hypothetical protein V4576_00345 [Patescibacteria group bacterium]
MSKDVNTIINTLQKIRPNKSVCLSDDKKASILKTVFETPIAKPIVHRHTSRIPSPFIVMFSRYVLPVFVLFFVGRVFGEGMLQKAQLAIGNYNDVKSEVKLNNSLLETRKDIVALKSLDTLNSDTDLAEKIALADKVTTGSREIRNQVASLVKENKITEAKQVVLTLETALKADELYKVATSVSNAVFETTDLRLELERQETEASVSRSATSSTSTINILNERLSADKKNLAKLEVTASTTDMIDSANKSLVKSEEYIKAGDVENAIISLQAHDRIVAELKLVLLP